MFVDAYYECQDCNVDLCVEPCFERVHTIKTYLTQQSANMATD